MDQESGMESKVMGDYQGVKLYKEEIRVLEKLEQIIGRSLFFGEDEVEIEDHSIISISLPEEKLTSLPENIYQLTKLKELILTNNALKTLPKSIGDLKNLELLTLEGNELYKLPDSIARLKKLKRLYLERNE